MRSALLLLGLALGGCAVVVDIEEPAPVDESVAEPAHDAVVIPPPSPCTATVPPFAACEVGGCPGKCWPALDTPDGLVVGECAPAVGCYPNEP